MRSPLLLDFLDNTSGVLALEQTAWSRLLGVFEAEARGGGLSDAEIRARLEVVSRTRSVPPAGAGDVALIPITGILFRHASFLGALLGWRSLTEIAADIEAAASNPGVKHAVLLVDTPGGAVDALPETAALVSELARQKPTTALVDTMAASGGYWLAVGAREIVAAPSSQAGAIGVILVHEEISRLQEKTGIATTVLTSGLHKGEAHPFAPLSAEDRAALQRRLDYFYGLFARAVAAGRRTTPEAVRNGYGQGRTLTAADALAVGLVDRFEAPRATLARIVAGTSRSAISASASVDPDLDLRRRRHNLAALARPLPLAAAPADLDRRRRRHALAEMTPPVPNTAADDLERRRRRHRLAETTQR